MITVVVIFKLLNFALLIFIVGYALRRYGLVSILKAMREERLEQEALEKKYQDLIKSCKEIEKEIHNQEIEFQDLEKKFQNWSAIVEKQQQKIIVEQQDRSIGVRKKEEKQLLYLKQKKLFKAEIPAILDEVALDFEQKIKEDEGVVKGYIAKIIDFIEK